MHGETVKINYKSVMMRLKEFHGRQNFDGGFLGEGEGEVKVKGKGKVHVRTSHEGPEREKMYSSTLPSTSALDGEDRMTS
jgi:hypothetical protein